MKKIIVPFILGLLVAGSVVYAAEEISSNSIRYKNTTVEAALNELYETAENNVMCGSSIASICKKNIIISHKLQSNSFYRFNLDKSLSEGDTIIYDIIYSTSNTLSWLDFNDAGITDYTLTNLSNGQKRITGSITITSNMISVRDGYDFSKYRFIDLQFNGTVNSVNIISANVYIY